MEPAVTHQTVHLRRGSHETPKSGACVVELASMLAGEDFSDHPDTVCPVIATFLRAYNDALDDERRQDLYPVASAIVGTAAPGADVSATRIRLIAEWGRAEAARRRPRRLLPIPDYRLDESIGLEIGRQAVRAIRRFDDQAHASALALVERLVAVTATAPRAPASSAPPSVRAGALQPPSARS
jgi:hypothetical protein